jgi:class 3 adenylate cyclase/tetratricopeptide (TPR) repeat protein
MKRPGDGAKVPAPSGTVTFLFSDIEGSTVRWDRDRRAMQEAVRVHDRLLRAAMAANGGHVFKTVGDAFCSAFATPESATSAALDAQRALGETDFSAVDGLRVRMAIDTGTADERDGDYFGPTLNRVARILSLGHGGQVLLSGVAADLVSGNPPAQATLADLGAHVLRDLERPEKVYQLVAPGLARDFPELRAAAERPWLVPDAMRTRYFTGRDDLIAQIRRQLTERHRAALSGLGGIGKTQTAVEYAVRHRSQYPDGVFWVNAETNGALTSAFVAIAAMLRLPAAQSNDRDAAVNVVLDWLRRTSNWLLILDNVEDRREVRRFVPEGAMGDVLITSRESVFQEFGIARALDVGDLGGDEAVRFLLARAGREDAASTERAAAAGLATELGYLPLALEQAAAYVAETGATFAGYLSAFRKRRVTLLEKAGGLVSHATVAGTWAANFAAVEAASPASADVLRVSALLAPDAIPLEFFSKGARALGEPIAAALSDPDELTLAELLRPLARYSLVRFDAASRAFSVHRLVQEIVRAESGESERRTYVERAAAACDAAFPEADFANWAECDRLVPHVVSIAGWVDSTAARPAAFGRILNQTGRYLTESGRYAEAEALLERALAMRERELGPDHPDVAYGLNNLANVYFDQGRFAEAQPLLERALATLQRAHGPDHPDVASSLNNLANVHSAREQYTQAQQLLERAVSIWERALGPDHPDVAISLNSLGDVEVKRARYARAQPLYERARAILEREFGPDHPDLGYSFDGLANVNLKQGRHAEAQPLFERALAIRERALGPDHPYVAETLIGLASLHSDQGRRSEAVALFERALVIRERTLAAGHPELAKIRNGLEALRAAAAKQHGTSASLIIS